MSAAGHHAYLYEFRHLGRGDINRGVLLRYPPEEPAQPKPAARSGDEGSSEKPTR